MQGFVKEKEFYKQAACIAIPISLQSVITIGVSMMDNIMVGALGETALSAVALANQFIGIYQIGCIDSKVLGNEGHHIAEKGSDDHVSDLYRTCTACIHGTDAAYTGSVDEDLHGGGRGNCAGGTLLSVDGTVLFASWAYTDVYADSQKRRTGSDSACKFCRRFFCQYIF